MTFPGSRTGTPIKIPLLPFKTSKSSKRKIFLKAMCSDNVYLVKLLYQPIIDEINVPLQPPMIGDMWPN